MADSTEELEPLFDYSRVQPLNLVCLDYDDDEDVGYLAKKRKTSKPVENGKTDVKAVPVVDIDEMDDDWLPPPPKVTSNAQKMIDEDSTIKELRLKKQELVSFAESAKNILKTVEESVKREISNSLSSSKDGTSETTTKPSERAKILISVQDKDESKQFRIYMDDKFDRIVKMYADKFRCDCKQIVLSFDGDKISPSETPASLGMEDDDIIEVHIKPN